MLPRTSSLASNGLCAVRSLGHATLPRPVRRGRRDRGRSRGKALRAIRVRDVEGRAVRLRASDDDGLGCTALEVNLGGERLSVTALHLDGCDLQVGSTPVEVRPEGQAALEDWIAAAMTRTEMKRIQLTMTPGALARVSGRVVSAIEANARSPARRGRGGTGAAPGPRHRIESMANIADRHGETDAETDSAPGGAAASAAVTPGARDPPRNPRTGGVALSALPLRG